MKRCIPVHDPMRKFMLRFILSVAVGVSMISCAYDSRKREPDMELMQVLYLYLTADRDLTGACMDAQNSAFACFSSTGDPSLAPSYTAVLSSIYSITVNPPGAASDICTPLIASPLYPDPSNNPSSPDYTTYSVGAKICFFRSEKGYWDALRSEGKCDPGLNPGISIDPNHAVYKQRLQDCLGTGTVLPF